jgi:manganese/zinc/iron transport system ATP- binding protein
MIEQLKSIFVRKETSFTLHDLPEHSSDSPLSIHSLSVAYDSKPVLWDVEFDCPSGALVAICGPNGAGKTTFIKSVLNLIPKLRGTVEFWGKSLDESRLRISYVPQKESVDWDFPVSVLDVVCMGLYSKIGLFKKVKKHHREKALECLKDVDLLEFADRQISQLSGGQQQRTFLARALAQDADLYLMDEPFAGVDAASERTIVQVLKKLKEQGATIIVVHHDLTTVEEYFDHVILINNRVIASGTVEQAFTQKNLKETYGGKLTLLEEVSEAIAKRDKGIV